MFNVPSRTGKLKDISSFDSVFFNVSAKQSNFMDPQLRLLLEVTYEAIIDAGYNPIELRGSKTGVFIGVTSSESVDYWTADADKSNG